MARSFHSKLREALDAEHLDAGRLATRTHYELKKAMREANMRGRQFQTPEELAEFITEGRRYA